MNKTSPINNIISMQELQGDNDLTGVESCSILIELLHLLDVMHQITAVQVFHHKEQVLLKVFSSKQSMDR